MNDERQAYAGGRPLERRAAHLQRLLLAFVQAAEAAASSDGEVHPLEDGEVSAGRPNRYRRAVVRLHDLTPLRAGWQELQRVAAEAHAAGVPSRSRVLPVVREGVRGVRVRSRTDAVGRELRASTVRGQAEAALERDLAMLARLDGGSGEGQREQQLHARIAELERVLRRIADAETLVVRWPVTRYHATLYYQDERRAERAYVPKPGVIVAGAAPRFELGQALRERRSDRVSIEPLCRWGAREIFDAAAYRKASEALRGTNQPHDPSG